MRRGRLENMELAMMMSAVDSVGMFGGLGVSFVEGRFAERWI
jgi:hypothetical protein